MTRGLFLFDIDGTLIKGGVQAHRDAFAQAFQTVYGLPLSLDGIVAAGRTDTWLLEEPLLRAGLSRAEIRPRMPEAFALMERYTEVHLPDLRDMVLPGVPELLEQLQATGQILGLLTGNLRGIALAKMERAGLAHFFQTGAFGEESEVRAHLVPVALRQFTPPILAHRTVVVGDTPLDVEAGQIGGTRTAAVATGRHSVEELRASGADLVLSSFADAPAAAHALLSLV